MRKSWGLARYLCTDLLRANQSRTTELGKVFDSISMIFEKERNQVMKNFRLKIKKFLEEENAEEYNGDTVGMYIGGTIGTLLMVAMILMGGM